LLKEKYLCEILLFGGPEDEEVVAKVDELSGHCAMSLVGRITLRELPAALSLCRVLITNDSAPMHIAVARRVPVVAMFCATTPSLGFYPYSSEAIVLEKDLPCRPCSSHGGRRCPLGTEDCMRLIEADRVLQAVERLLDPKGPPEFGMANRYLPQFVIV
jgi:heptosyltransferase II